MKAYLIRGQSSGVMHDRVFLSPPTEEQMAEALASELERHGIDPKSAAARERWVMAQEVELVPAVDGEPCAKLCGQLDDEATAKLLGEGPPGTALAGVGLVQPMGVGKVTNPGE